LAIKTLHITNHYHPNSGGIRIFYRALLEAADRHQREVRLVVPGVKDSMEKVGEFGRIYTIAAPKCPVFDSRYRLLLPHLYALPYPSALRKILQQEQPDLVEVCDKFALSCVPSVLRRNWVKGVSPAVLVGMSCERLDDNVSAYISDGPLARTLANWYVKKMYVTRFDCHISNSDYTAGELNQALVNRPEIQVHVRPMGVHCEGFSPDRRGVSAREALLSRISVVDAGASNPRLLLYVGRLSPEKNIDVLVEMMEILAADRSTEYHLLFAGDGPRAAWLKGVADLKSPGRIHLLGHLANRENLADIYANCDALVHPNAREPFGIAPLEAMASGLPVVAPRAGGVLSYANSTNAWLIKPTGLDFAAGVRDVFADDAARMAKIQQALRTAATFDWPQVAAVFFDLYDDLHRRFRKLYNVTANVRAPSEAYPTANL
jgi:glycosyltransferase involved in cell wall biosynthesis